MNIAKYMKRWLVLLLLLVMAAPYVSAPFVATSDAADMGFADRIRAVTTSMSGTGSFTLNTASTQYRLPPAALDGKAVEYIALDANGTGWETGIGTYTDSTKVLTRGFIASSTGSALSFSSGIHTIIFGGIAKSAESAYNASRGFISGLGPKWTSATVLGVVNGGGVFIESLNRVVYGAPADITPSSPSNSTWYHVYAYDNSGTLTLEASTTAPVAFATPVGNARSKSGDTSRRYLFSALTDGSGTFHRFDYNAGSNLVQWTGTIHSAPFRAVNGVSAGSSTTGDLSGAAPVTARAVLVKVTATGTATYLTTGDATVTTSFYTHVHSHLGSGAAPIGPVQVSATQTVSFYNGAGGALTYIDVLGWYLQR